MYVASSNGVYKSTDSGNSWLPFNESFPVNIKVNMFNEDRNGILYAATKANGLYRFNPIVDVKEESTNQNFCFDIFPNPAFEYIEISVGSRHALTNPDIRIFNVFGETVVNSSDLNNSQFSILNSQLRIDVSGLPSGVYFVRVGDKVGKFVKI